MIETKSIAGLVLIVAGAAFGSAASILSQRARGVLFFLMVASVAFESRLNINFMSHYWYRGVTRGFEITLMDLLAVSVLVGCLATPRYPDRPRVYWPMSLGPMLVFLAYAIGNVAASEPRLYGLFELTKLLRAGVVFLAAALFVRTQRELRLVFWSLALVMGLEGAAAIKQRLLDGLARAAGTIEHANSLSLYVCMTAPIFMAAATAALPKAMARTSYICVLLSVIVIVLTVSRAGLAIFPVVMIGAALFSGALSFSWKRVAGACVVCLIALAAAAYSWESVVERYSSASLEQEFLEEDNVKGRGHYFRLAMKVVEDKPWGVGLNNWSYWVSKKYGELMDLRYEDYDDYRYLGGAWPSDMVHRVRFAPPAHNLGLLTLGELGWAGLMLLGVLWIRWLQAGASFLFNRSPAFDRRMGLGIFFGMLGVSAQSMTEWIFLQTPILFTAHVMLGVLASVYHARKSGEFAMEDASEFGDSNLARIEETEWPAPARPQPAYV